MNSRVKFANIQQLIQEPVKIKTKLVNRQESPKKSLKRNIRAMKMARINVLREKQKSCSVFDKFKLEENMGMRSEKKLIKNFSCLKNIMPILNDIKKKPVNLFGQNRLENHFMKKSSSMSFPLSSTDAETSNRVQAIYHLEREPIARYEDPDSGYLITMRDDKQHFARPQSSYNTGRRPQSQIAIHHDGQHVHPKYQKGSLPKQTFLSGRKVEGKSMVLMSSTRTTDFEKKIKKKKREALKVMGTSQEKIEVQDEQKPQERRQIEVIQTREQEMQSYTIDGEMTQSIPMKVVYDKTSDQVVIQTEHSEPTALHLGDQMEVFYFKPTCELNADIKEFDSSTEMNQITKPGHQSSQESMIAEMEGIYNNFYETVSQNQIELKIARPQIFPRYTLSQIAPTRIKGCVSFDQANQLMLLEKSPKKKIKIKARPTTVSSSYFDTKDKPSIVYSQQILRDLEKVSSTSVFPPSFIQSQRKLISAQNSDLNLDYGQINLPSSKVTSYNMTPTKKKEQYMRRIQRARGSHYSSRMQQAAVDNQKGKDVKNVDKVKEKRSNIEYKYKFLAQMNNKKRKMVVEKSKSPPKQVKDPSPQPRPKSPSKHQEILVRPQLTSDGKFQILQPSFQDPKYRWKLKLVKKLNQVSLKLSDYSQLLSNQLVLHFPFTPLQFQSKVIRKNIMNNELKKGIINQLEKQALSKKTSKIKILQELNIKPNIETPKNGDFSSDNSDADVDIEYVKTITRYFDFDLIVYGLPITFTVRKKDNEGKDIIDIYLSTTNQRPNKENYQMHRNIRFGYKTKDNKDAPSIYSFEFNKKYLKDKIDPKELYINIESTRLCDLEISAELTQDLVLLDNMAREYQESKADISKDDLKIIDKKLQEFLPPDSNNKVDINKTKYKVGHAPKSNRRMLLAQKIREIQELQNMKEKVQKSIKWQVYRNERENQMDKFIKQFKHNSKIKHWVTIVRKYHIIKKIVENYDLWREKNRQLCNNIFMAIKMKVRFRTRFLKKYGYHFETRMKKHIHRAFSLTSICQLDTTLSRASHCILRLLQKKLYNSEMTMKVKKFIRSAITIQNFWKNRKVIREIRKEQCKYRCERYLKYMKWLYEHKMGSNVSNKREMNRYSRVNYALRDVQIDPEIIENALLKYYYEYVLDYCIWKYFNIDTQIDQMQWKKDISYPQKRVLKLEMKKCQNQLIHKMHFLQIKIFQSDGIAYDMTTLVDLDQLYNFDPHFEGGDSHHDQECHLDEPKLKKKKKLSKTVQSNKTPPVMHEHRYSTTFKKFEKQIGIIEYLNRKQKLEENDEEIDECTDYHQYLVDTFPPFKFAMPAENILRIIVKSGKLDKFI